jgi:hypothetical protein
MIGAELEGSRWDRTACLRLRHTAVSATHSDRNRDSKQPPGRSGEAVPRPSSFRTTLRGWRWAARALTSQHAPYLILARRRHKRDIATGDTQLVIDGFPRSGNTFAVVAFQLAQPAPTRVSHHLHSAAHIVAAAKRGTPIVVTIRQPQDAVISCVIREPYVTINRALKAYIALYERLETVRDHVVVADFEDVTTNMGGVIDRVNDRFGTTFARFSNTPESVAQCFEIIEDRARQPPWAKTISAFLSGAATLDQLQQAATRSRTDDAPPPIPEHKVPRPSRQRLQPKRELQASYSAPQHTRLRLKAEQVHARFGEPA